MELRNPVRTCAGAVIELKRINIAVHGRFHAFDLAAALLRAGHDVHLLTNYPRRIVARWFPADRTSSHLLQGALARTADRWLPGSPRAEPGLKRMFGRWAARQNVRSRANVMHCWSGIAEETLRACAGTATCTVARGSAHVSTQYSLLAEEEERVGRKLEKPSPWIRAREEREYQLAHRIIVPSTFAQRTFLEQGIPQERVSVVGLSLRAPAFAAEESVIEERLQRLRRNEPLRVLYTGMVSYRKGMHDLQAAIQRLSARMRFRLVGPVLPECAALVRTLSAHAEIVGAVAERTLAAAYAWADVFVLPSIEDGFGVVLAQAQAAGLPILTTTNCGGPDIIAGGGQGWVVPIRSPDSIIERLESCDAQREEVCRLVEQLGQQPPTRGWADAAEDFVRAVS